MEARSLKSTQNKTNEKSKYKKLAANALILAVGQFGSKFLVYLMMRFYTNTLSDDGYGAVSNIVNASTLSMSLCTLGIGEAVITFGLDREYDNRQVFRIGLFCTIGGLFIFAPMIQLLGFVDFLQHYVWLITIYVITGSIKSTLSLFVRSSGHVKLFATDGVITTVNNILLNLVLLGVFHAGVEGYVFSVVIADLISIVFLTFAAKLWRELRFIVATEKTSVRRQRNIAAARKKRLTEKTLTPYEELSRKRNETDGLTDNAEPKSNAVSAAETITFHARVSPRPARLAKHARANSAEKRPRNAHARVVTYKPYFDKDILKKMLAFALPMIPTSIMWWVTGVSDGFFITAILGVGVNGIYMAAYKLPNIISLVSGIFSQAWNMSAVSENSESGGNRKAMSEFYTNVFDVYMSGVYLLAAGLLLVIRPALFVMTSAEFSEAYRYTPFLTFSVIFTCFSSFMGSVYVMKKQSVRSLVTATAGAVVNLALNALMIPVIGAQGAAAATFVSYVAVYALRRYDARRVVDIKINRRKLVLNLLLVFDMGLILERDMPAVWYYGMLALFFAGTVAANGDTLGRLVNMILSRIRGGAGGTGAAETKQAGRVRK